MPQRLCQTLLPSLPLSNKPTYDRAALKNGIVHLGIGAFHRAHQAAYTDAVLRQFGGDWGIIGCSLRSASVQQQLQPQDGLYSILQKGEENSVRIVGSVSQVLVGPQDPSAVYEAIALPNIRLVSLTITEKGYCHNPATGQLNLDHPDVQHDLGHLTAPRSALGYLVAGLQRRFEQNLSGVTVLSCDNLPNNGHVTEAVVRQFAAQVSAELAQWIVQNVTFPCTMVDRIVPATTAEDIAQFERENGYQDYGLVVAEPFSQWVIEDKFRHDRPAWEKVGALLVHDVDRYETMKLRLLNGCHSLIAYAGYLAGYDTVYEVMNNAQFQRLCRHFMTTAAASLIAPENFDIDAYQTQLLQRFSNPGLKHRTWQIAMDGSQKIPQRWLNTLRQLIHQDQPHDIFSFALAAWLRFTMGVDETGKAIDVSDPMAEQFKHLANTVGDDAHAYTEAFLANEAIFGADLSHRSDLIKTTGEYLAQMRRQGLMATLTDFLAQVR